jgi:2-methylisocitrate lyase-like PEP mutase family enzyme
MVSDNSKKTYFMTEPVSEILLQRAQAFKQLHEQPGLFVMPNPWDAGSAMILETMGFKALATTSAGLAYALGKPDGHASITREQTLANARAILTATQLPVSADLENGYGDDPHSCAETILRAGEAGLCGGSIEDATGKPADPIYPFDLALERVKAAVAAKKQLNLPFILTARAENLIYGRIDLADTIRRLEAYAEAGADVLFAPGLKTKDEIETVVKAVAPKPLNVIMGLSRGNLSLQILEQAGVKRVSVGSSLSRAALGALFRAGDEILQKGTFGFAEEAKSYAELNSLFARYS